MKISRFFPWLKEFFGNNGVEIMVVCAIILLLSAIVIPNFQAAKRQHAIQRTTQTFEIGDSVYIDTLNIKGRINEVHRFSNPEYDILIVGSNGEPTLIKNIKGKLLKKDMMDADQANTGSGGNEPNKNCLTTAQAIAQAITVLVAVGFLCFLFYSIGKTQGEANQRARLVSYGIVKYEVTTNDVVKTNTFVVVKP